jgi:Xaa-Pro aminopeptidase
MRAIFAILLTLGPLLADGIPLSEYRTRRAELRKSLDGVMVLFGANESDDLHTGFFQNTDFLYLSGWTEPGAVILLTPKEEILFLPPHNPAVERFTGVRTGADDAAAPEKSGFDQVLSRSALETRFLRTLEASKRIYLDPDDAGAKKLHQISPFHEEKPAGPVIAKLRLIKSPAEIELIAGSSNATIAAHQAAWKSMKPGLFEYEIAATMTNVYLERGCERSAYAPIVGSGPNGLVLHYSANRRRTDSGDLVLMDVGAECSGYATDVTRTVPVTGKFSMRQREIYEIVLGAQKAAIAAIKPGAKIRGSEGSLEDIARRYIDTHGHDLLGQSLGKYFIHGLSHFVGLDVHDPGDITTPLEPGMVLTIEPGVYLPDENLAVRIEDTLVVTANGSRNLSEALPREPEEIERLVGK